MPLASYLRCGTAPPKPGKHLLCHYVLLPLRVLVLWSYSALHQTRLYSLIPRPGLRVLHPRALHILVVRRLYSWHIRFIKYLLKVTTNITFNSFQRIICIICIFKRKIYSEFPVCKPPNSLGICKLKNVCECFGAQYCKIMTVRNFINS